MENANPTSITDLYAAAFLTASGNKVLGIHMDGQTGNGQRRHAFLFETNTKLREDMRRLVNNEEVPVRSFIDSVYALKRLLRSGVENPK